MIIVAPNASVDPKINTQVRMTLLHEEEDDHNQKD